MNLPQSNKTHYAIKFSINKSSTIINLYLFLDNLEKLLTRTTRLIDILYNVSKFKEIQAIYSNFDTGIFSRDFTIQFNIDVNISDETIKVVDKLIKFNKAINFITALCLAYLKNSQIAFIFTNTSQSSVNVKASDNNNIHIIVNGFNFGSLDIQVMLKEANQGTNQLAHEAIGTPNLYHAVEIVVSDYTYLTTESQMIGESHEEFAPLLPIERKISYRAVGVHIHASDQDHYDKGWAGTVLGVTDGRKNFKLENVCPAIIHGKSVIKADITTNERFYRNLNKYIVSDFTVTRIY